MTRSAARAALLALAAALGPAPGQAQDCLCLRCLITGERAFYLPAAHMEPTLEVNQCFLARIGKGAELGIRPGDIVVFRHPVQQIEHVFRVVAQGGQTIALSAGIPVIDGTPVRHDPRPDYLLAPPPAGAPPGWQRCPAPARPGEPCKIARLRETLPNGVAYDILSLAPQSIGDDTPAVTVPKGHVFVLGDNRDNAMDSRFPRAAGGPGLVPLDAVTGVVTEILD